MLRTKKLKRITTLIIIFSLFMTVSIAFIRGTGQSGAEGHNAHEQANTRATQEKH